jgi:WD40 repeat protein
VRIWDPDTGRAVHVLPQAGGSALAWSRDGKRLANTFVAGLVVKVWDAETGKEVLQLNYQGGVLGLSWGPGGRLAGSSPNGTVRVWKVVD